MKRFLAIAVLMGAHGVVSELRCRAQDAMPEGPVRRFTLPILDKQTLRRKALVRGDTARPLAREVYEIDGMHLEFFTADDRTNLVVTAPRCVCRLKQESVSSPGPIEVRSPDGRFRLQGTGFGWVEAEGLAVSNAVQAVIRKDLLREREGMVAPHAEAAEFLEIRSDRFRYRAGAASFEDNVRVQDPSGTIRCAELRLVLEAGGEIGVRADVGGDLKKKLQTIEAAGDVRIESPELVASADRAVYGLEDERLELSGQPRWRAGEREGQAERVEIFRVSRELRAAGAVQMRTPAEGFFADEGLLTGETSARLEPAGPRWLDVSSETFRLRPAAGRTNVQEAVFEGKVRVQEAGKGNLECEQLALEYAPGSQGTGSGRSVDAGASSLQLRGAVADRQVVFAQESNRVSCVRAVYAAETRRLEMANGVDWELGGRSGRSDRLLLDGVERSSLATGEVRMRLPAGSFAPAAAVLTGRAGKGREEPATAVGTNGPVEIRCQEFAYAASRGGTNLAEAVYRGGVEVLNPPGMKLTCEELKVWIEPPSNRVQRLVADRNVEMAMEDLNGRRRARGDQAVYTAAGEELRLLGDRGVAMEWVSATETNRATGASVRYDGTRDRLELIGNAALVSPRGRVVGDRLWVNRANGLVSASGLWTIRLPARELKGQVPLERNRK